MVPKQFKKLKTIIRESKNQKDSIANQKREKEFQLYIQKKKATYMNLEKSDNNQTEEFNREKELDA